jgi:hypothetical protein
VPATSPEEAASATSGPPIITTEDDDPATILVPAIDPAPPANDNTPTEDTLLVDAPTAPKPAPYPIPPEPANDNSPTELPVTGTE